MNSPISRFVDVVVFTFRSACWAWSERRDRQADFLVMRARWRTCAANGHRWQLDNDCHDAGFSIQPMHCWRCERCGCFEWDREPPAANYYRDPEHLIE